MLQEGGWWVDTDVLCLSADVPADELVLGWENETTIGSAVMRFPPRHPVIAAANEFWIANRQVPTWGHTGPRLVTRLVKELGFAERAAPVKVLYPIGWEDALAPFDPGRRDEVEALTQNRPFLHLWNSSLFFMSVGRDLLAPRGSYLRAAIDHHLGDAVRARPDDPFISAILHAVQNRHDLMNQYGRRADEAGARIEQLLQDQRRLEGELARLKIAHDELRMSRAVRLLRKLGWA
jgi:Alpha 1,4-glycosyltransferase conserved region